MYAWPCLDQRAHSNFFKTRPLLLNEVWLLLLLVQVNHRWSIRTGYLQVRQQCPLLLTYLKHCTSCFHPIVGFVATVRKNLHLNSSFGRNRWQTSIYFARKSFDGSERLHSFHELHYCCQPSFGKAHYCHSFQMNKFQIFFFRVVPCGRFQGFYFQD